MMNKYQSIVIAKIHINLIAFNVIIWTYLSEVY